jgi:hypothetical protein
MPIVPGFCGPTNAQRSPNVDAERTINWYMEAAGTGTPKVDWSLQPTPGAFPYAGLYAGPSRGSLAQNGRVFWVGGGVFHEVFASQTTLIRGTVAVDGHPAFLATNGLAGNQVMVTSGGLAYIFDLVANTFVQVTDPSFPAVVTQVLFFDGFFIVLTPLGQFFLSSLEDGTTWNAVDFGAENQFSDTVIAMSKTHDNLWLYGTQNTGPYYNSGQPFTPYIPIPGALIEHGIVAPSSAIEIDNTTYWMGQDEHGVAGFYRANGYTPLHISNPAIDYLLLGVQNQLAQSRSWGMQLQSHLWYVTYVPGLDKSLVYDIASQNWFEWGHWIPALNHFVPHVAVDHVYAFGEHLVGDRQSGMIYALRPDQASDLLALLVA